MEGKLVISLWRGVRTISTSLTLVLLSQAAAWASDAGWPKPVPAPPDAPNVLVILTDDVGFGSTSAFGGPVPTPAFDAVARQGLRYNRFHTTALCSPTRASLLTGRNPHSVEMGTLTNTPRPQAGYTTVIPKSAGTIAQVLQQNGYATAAFGKWHVVPEWETSRAGPFDRWPSGLGFDYYYGFLEGSTDQWAPSLHENISDTDRKRSTGDADAECRQQELRVALRESKQESRQCGSKHDGCQDTPAADLIGPDAQNDAQDRTRKYWQANEQS